MIPGVWLGDLRIATSRGRHVPVASYGFYVFFYVCIFHFSCSNLSSHSQKQKTKGQVVKSVPYPGNSNISTHYALLERSPAVLSTQYFKTLSPVDC